MNDLYKLYRVMLIGLIGIVLSFTLSGCWIEKLVGPDIKPCRIVVANPTNYTLGVCVDGQTYWNYNYPPDQVWIKDQLEDGSIHEIQVSTRDPRIFNETYRVRVVAGKTFAYGDYTGNAIVRIGGSVSSAALTPESPDLR